MTVDLKAKFHDQWQHSNLREQVARLWLQMFGVEAEPTGFGTLNPGTLEGFHTNPMEKYDFYVPALKVFFEVTGTSWRRFESAKRFKTPIIPILKAKVDFAEYFGIAGRVWFIAVAEAQGEVRFFPCSRARDFPTGHFAQGEGEYYMVPWDAWWTPGRAMHKILGSVWEE